MKSKVLKATIMVFCLSLIAKMIAFFKSVIQASFFGATIYTDAYNVTSGFVTNIVYMFTTALAVAFVPIYIQHKSADNSQKRFASRTIAFLILSSIAVTFILVLNSSWIVSLIAPSFWGEQLDIAIKYFRILVLGLTFALGSNLYTNLLNAEKIYGFSSFGSIINSIVLIAMILLFAKDFGVWALVCSIPISFFAQWVLVYIIGRKYAPISFAKPLVDDDIKVLILQATPILLSQATVEINQVVDRALLSSVGTGTLTAVSYSAILYQFATTLITTPVSSVIFTELSEAGAKKDFDEIIRLLQNCYKILFVTCIPIVVVMWICSYDIVNIVYGHGKYSAAAIEQSSIGLAMYGLCLLPVCIKNVLSRAYYSLNNTKKPMIFGIVEVIINISLSIILVADYGIRGVVGATSIASLCMIFVMLIDFEAKYMRVFTKQYIICYWKVIVASICLILMMIEIRSLFFINSLLNFTLKTIIASFFYFLVLLVLREESLLKITKSLICKFIRS